MPSLPVANIAKDNRGDEVHPTVARAGQKAAQAAGYVPGRLAGEGGAAGGAAGER